MSMTFGTPESGIHSIAPFIEVAGSNPSLREEVYKVPTEDLVRVINGSDYKLIRECGVTEEGVIEALIKEKTYIVVRFERELQPPKTVEEALEQYKAWQIEKNIDLQALWKKHIVSPAKVRVDDVLGHGQEILPGLLAYGEWLRAKNPSLYTEAMSSIMKMGEALALMGLGVRDEIKQKGDSREAQSRGARFMSMLTAEMMETNSSGKYISNPEHFWQTIKEVTPIAIPEYENALEAQQVGSLAEVITARTLAESETIKKAGLEVFVSGATDDQYHGYDLFIGKRTGNKNEVDIKLFIDVKASNAFIQAVGFRSRNKLYRVSSPIEGASLRDLKEFYNTPLNLVEYAEREKIPGLSVRPPKGIFGALGENPNVDQEDLEYFKADLESMVMYMVRKGEEEP
ncbi:MAG: hypothetical protein WC243_00765 [Patescibacteria group bacterium]|jgi:hypothetical protein